MSNEAPSEVLTKSIDFTSSFSVFVFIFYFLGVVYI